MNDYFFLAAGFLAGAFAAAGFFAAAFAAGFAAAFAIVIPPRLMAEKMNQETRSPTSGAPARRHDVHRKILPSSR